ncbi:hypothetical protein BDR22DRAFT_851473 [Usnea florida]
MRTSAFVSALVLLLISPALAAPINVSESMLAENQPSTPAPAPAEGCTDQKLRRNWIPFWRRQDPPTIVGANDCGFTQASGTAWRLHF